MVETPDTPVFYHLLADDYDRLFPVTDQQRRFLVELVEDRRIRRVLDVACGSGEQAGVFRALGLDVSALENDEKMLGLVRGKDPAIDVRLGSMECVAELFEPGFDLVLCIGNSLPHLADLDAVSRTLDGMRSLLNVGGTLLVSIVNFDRVMRDRIDALPVKRVTDASGRPMTFERFYDLSGLPERVIFRMKLSVGEETHTASVTLIPLSPDWLTDQIAGLGLEIVGRYAGFDGAPFGPNSMSLVLVAARG